MSSSDEMSASEGHAPLSGAPRHPVDDRSFPASWTAEILSAPPLIAPARPLVVPRPVPGEEDALARGALQVLVRPAAGGAFLATCALGFRDPVLPSGVWSCPHPDDLLAVAGGYGYLVRSTAPEGAAHLFPRPITAVLAVPEAGLLLLAGFHEVVGVGREGVLWQTGRLSWEGVTLGSALDGKLQGLGWNLHTDREVPFAVDLKTGEHSGGGFP